MNVFGYRVFCGKSLAIILMLDVLLAGQPIWSVPRSADINSFAVLGFIKKNLEKTVAATPLLVADRPLYAVPVWARFSEQIYSHLQRREDGLSEMVSQASPAPFLEPVSGLSTLEEPLCKQSESSTQHSFFAEEKNSVVPSGRVSCVRKAVSEKNATPRLSRVSVTPKYSERVVTLFLGADRGKTLPVLYLFKRLKMLPISAFSVSSKRLYEVLQKRERSLASFQRVRGNRDFVGRGSFSPPTETSVNAFTLPKDLFIAQSVTSPQFVGTLLGSAEGNVLKAGDMMTGNLVMSGQSGIIFADALSEASVKLQAPEVVGQSYALTFPADVGPAEAAFVNTGDGILGWQDISTGSKYIQNGGNQLGAALTIGTRDAFGLHFQTNQTDRLIIAADGSTQLLGAASITGPLAVSDRVTISAGGIDVTGEVDIHGDIDFIGNLEVTGKLSSSDTLTVSGGGAAITGTGLFTDTVTAPTFVGNLTGLASANVAKSGDVMTGNLTLQQASAIVFADADSDRHVTFAAPEEVVTSYTLRLPDRMGTLGYVLGLKDVTTGELDWLDISSDSQIVHTGGNIVPEGESFIIGANSTNSLGLVSGGVTQLSIQPTGDASITGDLFVGGGDVHLQVSGALGPAVTLSCPTGLTASYGLSLPLADGTSGQFLSTNGAGQLQWITQTLPENLVYTNGNTVSAPMNIGTANGYGLSLQTNSSARMSISSDGIITTHRPVWAEDTVLIKNQHELRLEDSAARWIALKSPATLAAAYTLTLPPDDGDAGEVLITDGAGHLSWTGAPMPAGAVALGGNAVAATMKVGTLTAQDFSLITNDVGRVTIGSEGVYAATVDPASALSVVMDNTGKIGTHVSSARFKSGIMDISDEHDRFMKLRPVRYHLKRDARKTPLYGFLAEELAQVYPELVVYDNDGQPLGIKEYQLFGILVHELQRLNDEVKTLRQQMAFLLG